MSGRMWRCVGIGCGTLNLDRRGTCRRCGRGMPTEAEKKAFTQVAIPAMLAERARLRSELAAASGEARRLGSQLSDIGGRQ